MANQTARKNGVSVGLSLSDARARVPALISEPIDRASDVKALDKLTEWLVRFSPLIARDGEDGLMLETTGCDHLFGGETGMARELSRRLKGAGYSHRMAFASTPAAAWALARGGKALAICAEGGERAALSELPVGCLRLADETCQLLRRFGLTRVGQLYGLDRKALARRFQSASAAGQVVLRLDQALGLRHEPLDPFRAKPDFTARLSCPEPLISGEGVSAGLAQLTEEICAALSEAGQGARGFHFHAFRAEGGVSSVAVHAARPVRDVKHLMRLFGERIDRIDPGFGIDFLILEARLTGSVEVGPVSLSPELSGKARNDIALSRLADRVSARLGDGAVTLRWPVASHLPERAEDIRVFEGIWPEALATHETGPRPLRRFDKPERVQVLAEVPDGPPLRFIWRKQTRRVVRADGPERIAPEWWCFFEEEGDRSDKCSTAVPCPSDSGPSAPARSFVMSAPHDQGSGAASPSGTQGIAGEHIQISGQNKHPRAKDYYRVEDENGRRYWIARVGLYHDGQAIPHWVMEGLFP